MASNDPFSSAPAPSQANIAKSQIRFPTLQWLGSPNNEHTGWYIGQAFVEVIPGANFHEPPAGLRVGEALFGGKQVQGWVPANEQGALTIHTIRSAFRWEVWDDANRRTHLFYGFNDAKAFAERIGEKMKSRFMALVYVKELGDVPIFLTSHGDVTREMRAFIGWGSQPKYHSVVQRMAQVATAASQRAGRNVAWGVEVFGLPIGRGKQRRAGQGSNTSIVVPPAIIAPIPEEIDVQTAANHFDKERADLWGEGGLFEKWLNDTEEGGVFWDWERRTKAGGAEEAEEAEDSGASGNGTGAGWTDDVPGMEPASLGNRLSVPPPDDASKRAPGPALPTSATPSRDDIAARLTQTRNEVLALAKAAGYSASDQPIDKDFHTVYDALRISGVAATQENLSRAILDFYGPGATQNLSRVQIRALDTFLRAPQYGELREYLWSQ